MPESANRSVLLVPFFADNQYQGLLRDCLGARGLDIRLEDGPRPMRFFAHRLIGVDVLHVHWIHPYFLFGSYDRLYRLPLSWLFCAVSAVIFVTQVAFGSLLGTRIIWTVHNECNHERRYERLDRWTGRRVAALADVILVWDETTRERAMAAFDIPRSKTRIVPHGNYLPLYGSKPAKQDAREALRDRLGITAYSGGPLYLAFGVIRPYKGIPDLLRTFTVVAPEDATLVVAGTTKYVGLEREIRSLASGDERVHLDLEYVPDEWVPKYFAAADFVVLPYRHVFNSGSVVLAMGFGCPLVVPAMGSIPAVVPDGNVFYDDLAAGIRRSGDLSADERERVGRENLRVAERDHDWGLVVDRLLAAYEGGDEPSHGTADG